MTDGMWEPVTDGYVGKPRAGDYMEALLAPSYNVASTTGSVYENGGSRNHKMPELMFKYGRYNAIQGSGVKNKAENLSAYVMLSMRDQMRYEGKGRPNEEFSRGLQGDDVLDALKSFRVLTNEAKLSRESLYDAFGRTISHIEGNMMSDFNNNFLTAEELVAFKKGKQFLNTFDPRARTAEGAKFVSNINGYSQMFQSDRNRVFNHENMLRFESAKAQTLISQGIDYFQKQRKEGGWSKHQKFTPETPYERSLALNQYADGMSVQIMRSILSSTDRQPGLAKRRLAKAQWVRDRRDELWSKLINQARFGADTTELITPEMKNAMIEGYVAEYLAEFGQEGNEMVAMMDLFTPKGDGFFIDGGVEFTNYRKFPTDLYNTAMKFSSAGLAGSGMSPSGTGAAHGNILQKDMHRLMSYTRSTMDRILSSDRQGIHELKNIIEAVEENGNSVATAIQARDIGRWPTRINKMRRNISVIGASRTLGMEAAGSGNPINDLLGGFVEYNRSNQLLELLSTGDNPIQRKVKVLHDWQGWPNTGGFDRNFIDVIDQQAKSGSWLMLFSEKAPYKIDGFHASRIGQEYTRKEKRELSKGLKRGQEVNEAELAARVHQREAKFYNLLLEVLGERGSGPDKLTAKGSTMKHDNAADYIRDKWFETCE
jgi:hypothetical protein